MPLSLVLHSHMPYVEGFGTWPFGEEWLFEAMASSYLRLLDVTGFSQVTLGITPVLADQLAAPGLGERFLAFCRDLRPASHALDVEAAGSRAEAAELARAAGDYARAADRYAALEAAGGLLTTLRPPAGLLASAATHAVLPLCATGAGVDLQLRVGVGSHRARFGSWDGGFWLPECAHAPWLDDHLAAAGVRFTCVDLTDVYGRGATDHLQPLKSGSGITLVPIDREVLELAWSPRGYPSAGAYRDYHRRSARDHHPWAVDGSVYDPERAREQTAADAEDFARRVAQRLEDGGLCVCAMDTELLGHWWYEGPWWLDAVLAACARHGVEVVPLGEALTGIDPAPAPELPTTTWGTPRDLSTWDQPGIVAELAGQARAAELRVHAAGAAASPRAVRELLALQSSDWAFQMTNQLAGSYPVERAAGHRAALDQALEHDALPDELRHLAPLATPGDLALR